MRATLRFTLFAFFLTFSCLLVFLTLWPAQLIPRSLGYLVLMALS